MKTIASENTQDSHVSTEATPAPADQVLTRVPDDTPASKASPPAHVEGHAKQADSSPTVTESKPPASKASAPRYRKWLIWAGIVAALR